MFLIHCVLLTCPPSIGWSRCAPSPRASRFISVSSFALELCSFISLSLSLSLSLCLSFMPLFVHSVSSVAFIFPSSRYPHRRPVASSQTKRSSTFWRVVFIFIFEIDRLCLSFVDVARPSTRRIISKAQTRGAVSVRRRPLASAGAEASPWRPSASAAAVAMATRPVGPLMTSFPWNINQLAPPPTPSPTLGPVHHVVVDGSCESHTS